MSPSTFIAPINCRKAYLGTGGRRSPGFIGNKSISTTSLAAVRSTIAYLNTAANTLESKQFQLNSKDAASSSYLFFHESKPEMPDAIDKKLSDLSYNQPE